ncbi:MAG: hypothetical protein H6825_12775 [Planctomycetes bacterium]|nr:hypothetical protein [Planctomycetota bacterium]
MRKLLMLGAVLLACFVVVPHVDAHPFCYDQTDKLIVKLKKVDLTTEQLKDVFQYQKEQRALIAACHEDGRGCAVHEKAELDFQKRSIGVLTDDQFQKFAGRERTEEEQLRYDNYLLKKEVERLNAELAAMKQQMAEIKAALVQQKVGTR